MGNDIKSRNEKTQKVTEAIKMIMEAHVIGKVER